MENIYLLSFIGWLGYCYFTAVGDGYFYHMINKKILVDKDEHDVFTYERITVCVIYTCVSISCGGWNILNIIAPVAICLFTFSFVHNGSYYWTRSRLTVRHNENLGNGTNGIVVEMKDPYPKKWWAQSSTSRKTPFWTRVMTPKVRTIFFVLGVAIFILHYIRMMCDC